MRLGLLGSCETAPSRSQIIHMYPVQQHSPDLEEGLPDINEQPDPWSAYAFACPRTGRKLCATQQQEHVCFLTGSLSQCNFTGNTFPSARIWYIWERTSKTTGHIYIQQLCNWTHQMLLGRISPYCMTHWVATGSHTLGLYDSKRPAHKKSGNEITWKLKQSFVDPSPMAFSQNHFFFPCTSIWIG